MGMFHKDIKTLDDLFVHMLRDIHYAENQTMKALPTMIGKVTDPVLREGLADHLEETREHVTRLDRVFQMHGAENKTTDCPAIDGILKEAREVAGNVADARVLDAAIIASAQAVEHYEITRYGTLIALANELGRADCAAVLEETLDEETGADEMLTEIAGARINSMAA